MIPIVIRGLGVLIGIIVAQQRRILRLPLFMVLNASLRCNHCVFSQSLLVRLPPQRGIHVVLGGKSAIMVHVTQFQGVSGGGGGEMDKVHIPDENL
jgi:hypothetical protein